MGGTIMATTLGDKMKSIGSERRKKIETRVAELERIRRYEALSRCRTVCEKEINILEKVVEELEDKHTKALEYIRQLEKEIWEYQQRLYDRGDADE